MTPPVAPASTSAATTGQALDDYDRAMRERAAKHGRPLKRSMLPGLHLDDRVPGYLVLTNRDGDLRARQWGREESVPVTFALLIEMWRSVIENGDEADGAHSASTTAPIAVVIADTETRRALVRLARHETKDPNSRQEAYGVHRALAYRSGLPFSTVFPVLSEALASRYWLPTDHDASNVIDWGLAFDLAAPVGSAVWFQELFDLASAHDGFEARLMREVVRSEPFGYRAAWYSSSHAQCSAFNQAGKITDAYQAMVASDPLLIERNMLTGDLTQVVVTSVEGKHVSARIVGEPGKLREDSKVIVFSPTDVTDRAEVTLDGVVIDGPDLVARLTVSTRSKARSAVVAAHASGDPLYLTPAPFLAFQRSPANRRWTSGDADARGAVFEMPADIATAGAPKA